MAARLLAVDLGLRSGLAYFDSDGHLYRYESKHFASRAALKQVSFSLLRQSPELTHLCIEGGGELYHPWQKAAEKRGITVIQCSAEEWRNDLLYQREQRSGKSAKAFADALAREIIDWSGAKRPTSLRHDVAEAILVGFWATVRLGWVESLPKGIKLRAEG